MLPFLCQDWTPALDQFPGFHAENKRIGQVSLQFMHAQTVHKKQELLTLL